MTNRKDMANANADKDNQDQEWDFTDVRSPVKLEQGQAGTESRPKALDSRKVQRKDPSLKLDEHNSSRAKTRTAMAKELEDQKRKNEEDVFHLASIPKRATAFVLDALFMMSIPFILKLTSPICRKLIQLFLDKYKLRLLLPEPLFMKGILAVNGFIALYFLVVIPLAFFNLSFGKKMLGLRVRGENRYTLSIGQAFKRELIMKPLSILLIAGFITPFFSKKRLSIHDMLAGTFVIEE
ncbi:MAG: RDD family protein [Bacteriovorax sp.]